MKKVFSLLLAFTAFLSANAQNIIYAPADMVWLRAGAKGQLHIREITKPDRAKAPGYLIRTHEALDLLPAETWTKTAGQFVWQPEKHSEGLWSTEVDKIVFADGFELVFHDGEIDRSTLLQAPTFETIHNNIYAEGVIELTKDETRSLLGEEAYLLGYRVYSRQKKVGLGKTIAAMPLIGIAVWQRAQGNKGIEESSFTPKAGYSSARKFEMDALQYTAVPAAVVTAVYGLTESYISDLKSRKVLKTYDTWQAPSKGKYTAKALVGGGLIAAGAAAIGIGYGNISKNGVWYEYYKTDVGPEHKGLTEGKKPAAAWLLPAAGALLLNAGVSELSIGLNGLGGYKLLQQTGLDRAQVHVGPTWDGVGLSVVF